MRVPATHKQRDSIIFQRRLALLCRSSKQHELIKWRSRARRSSIRFFQMHARHAHAHMSTRTRVAPRVCMYDMSSGEGSTLEASGHVDVQAPRVTHRAAHGAYITPRVNPHHHQQHQRRRPHLLDSCSFRVAAAVGFSVCLHRGVLVIIITRDKKNEPGERNSRDRCVDLLSVFPCNQTAGPDCQVGGAR